MNLNRFEEALYIQHGATNPCSVARALVKAIEETRADGQDPRADPACRAICHQLALLLRTDVFDFNYRIQMEECRVRCPDGSNALEM